MGTSVGTRLDSSFMMDIPYYIQESVNSAVTFSWTVFSQDYWNAQTPEGMYKPPSTSSLAESSFHCRNGQFKEPIRGCSSYSELTLQAGNTVMPYMSLCNW